MWGPLCVSHDVPIIEIAKAMHKDAQYVRVGLQQGIFRFGYAINRCTIFFRNRRIHR